MNITSNYRASDHDRMWQCATTSYVKTCTRRILRAFLRDFEEITKNYGLKILKGFFHGSAHARVLRNLICVPARNKPISEVLHGEVSKVDFILKNLSLYYTSVIRNCFVWIIFYSGVGF